MVSIEGDKMRAVFQTPSEIESLKTKLFIHSQLRDAAQQMCKIKDIEIGLLRQKVEATERPPDMGWIKTAFEVFREAVKTRDRLFVRIVPCVCGSLEPRLQRTTKAIKKKNWYVFCPKCRNRTVGHFRSRRTAKLVWNEQNENGNRWNDKGLML